MFCNKKNMMNKWNILIFLSVILLLNLFSVPAQALTDISDCEYVIDNIRFWSGDLGSYIFGIEDFNGIDSVEVAVTRRIQGGDDDMLIFAYYSDARKLIGMSKLLINTRFGVESDFKVPIEIMNNEILSEIRVFMWNDLNDIAPLSNVLSSSNNIFINPSIENPEYAVIENFQYNEEYDSYLITVLDEDGATKRYFYDEDKTKVYESCGKRITNKSESFNLLKNYVYSDYENKVKRNITDRVVRYYFRKSTSEMLKVYFLSPSASTSDGTEYMKEFNAYENTLGLITMKNNTKIINLDEYLEGGYAYCVSCSWLTHGTLYEAYGYDGKIEGAYPFVMITDIDK